MALIPPGGLPEIVFSFDTTGSMSRCLAEVRSRLQDIIQRLQADIPAIRIAVFAHGDYCTKPIYVTKWIDFSTDVKGLCDFVINAEETDGIGDGGECYELVLRQVGEELSWTPGSNRVLVVVGDDNPHEPNFRGNKLKINWRKETQTLSKMGIKIYGVQCGSDSHAARFYKTISKETGGRHLQLESFSNIFDFLMAICYREHGADILHDYEKEVRARQADGELSTDMEVMFTSLRDGVASASPAKKDEKLPISKKAKTVPGVKTARKNLTFAGAAKKKVKVPNLKKTTYNRGVLRSKSRSKSLKKPKRFVAPVLRREEVFENNFCLRNMNWSPWIKVISPGVPINQEAIWDKRRGDKPGFRIKTIFSSKNNKPALYEIAVQAIRYGRRCVVFKKFCHHIPGNVNWETRLLGNRIVRAQVNNVVSQECSVYVRRVVYRRASSHINSMMRCYDYAWERVRSRPHARYVYKQGSIISSEEI